MIKKFENSKIVLENDGVIGRSIAEINDSEFVHLSLSPGKIVPDHALDINVVFYVVTGNGTISINGDSIEAEKNDIINVESGAQRSWVNNGNEILELFVIKKLK